MSQEKVKIVRRAIEAYERESLDGSLRYYDPEIEWTSTEAYIERATIAATRRAPLPRHDGGGVR